MEAAAVEEAKAHELEIEINDDAFTLFVHGVFFLLRSIRLRLKSSLSPMDQPSDSTVKPCEFNNRIVFESGLLQMREMCLAFKGDGKTYATKPYQLKSGSKFACQGCWNELQKYGQPHCAPFVF